MFKEMTAKFVVKEDSAFKDGRWKDDRSDFVFEVKRFESGCTAYGDRSGHTVEIVNHPETYKHHFDTRYAMISSDTDKWIDYWQNWIEDEYGLKLTMQSFIEKEVKEREDR